MFQIQPSVIWLRYWYGPSLYFPDIDGNFDLSSAKDIALLQVEVGSASSSSTTVSATDNTQHYPGFTTVVSKNLNCRSTPNFSMKVVQARI